MSEEVRSGSGSPGPFRGSLGGVSRAEPVRGTGKRLQTTE